ncbi:E3 ubiquitin-protein ligase RNF220 [Drosophila rhopaloa]|uniref:E3 ubiquitin-protein ligase RNF220 n=1 Tax=Drosophila rhopaloa TaxID=1041015 RepID=A0A6P4EHM8_DRORH|nr:E3 ubiquitin-protein ligase RNF220 [Drosophila rhopaloa]
MATDTVSNGENFAQHLTGNGEDDVICPTCDVKIKRSQVADHCQVEMERLHNPTSASNPSSQSAGSAAASATQGSGSGAGGRQPWSVFQRVQRNRQARQRQRTRKRPASPGPPASNSAPAAPVPTAAPPPPTTAPPPPPVGPESSQPTCPVCNHNFPQSNIQDHVNHCLRQSRRNGQANGERHSSEDSEDSEEYEEYEWAGQKRIRVSTLVQGGYSALGLGQTIKYNGNQQGQEDEDEDLNVDEDDTHIYGPNQYGEGDVIPLVNDDTEGNVSEADVTSYVRRLISSSDGPKANHSSEALVQETATTSNLEASPSREEPSTSRSTRSASQNLLQVIESLKAKLRLYEKQAQGKYKCLICIDDYKNPAISVSCWHVHCEQCWLQTLGARKLCPQCNSITTPKDLRRIYL